VSKIIFTFLLFQIALFGRLEDRIKHQCQNEYRESVSDYLIRMEEDIQTHGCRVIPLYASIITSKNFDLLDLLEENSMLMENLLEVFYLNEHLTQLLLYHDTLKQIVLNNGMNEKFIKNFLFLLQHALPQQAITQIEKETSYLNYYLLSAFYAKDQQEAISLLKRTKEAISLEVLPSFTLLLSAVGDSYSFENLLESFSIIQQELSSDAIRNLVHYPEYFIYLLYPKAVDLDLKTYSASQLKEKQQSIQKKALFVYQAMYAQYRYRQEVNPVDYALLSVANIYPYLLEQEDLEYDDFVMIIKRLIKKDYMITLFNEGKCSPQSKVNFALFGQGNLIDTHELLDKEKRFALNLLSALKDDPHAIFSFFYVANFYQDASREEWLLFKALFQTLPYDPVSRIAFLKKLELNGYFRNIITQDDYKKSVKAKDGTTYPKYKYILTTPYPAQSDPSLFEQILITNISDTQLKDALLELIQKDTEALATHTFTTFDKLARGADIVDTIDSSIFIASLLAAPFTGGSSLSYVAIKVAKRATKIGTKRGFKAMIKRVKLQSRKFTNKDIKKVSIERESLNGAIFEAKNIKKSEKLMDKTENVVGQINSVVQVSALAGSTLYLYLNQSALLTKQICKEP